jgi:CRISPR-associated protein Cas4
MGQFANFILKKQPYNLKQLSEVLDASYSNGMNKTEFKQKAGFSASTIGYGSGVCPRRWVMAFRGAEFVEEYTSHSVDNMDAGTAAHERIQKNFSNSDLNIEVEHEFWSEDPPLHGFIDVTIKEFNGYTIVIEIKTTRTEAFQSRRAKNRGPDYQVLQLLLYLYFKQEQYGLLLYEDKNDHSKLLIPVEMDESNRAKIEAVVEWMRKVYQAYQDDLLPERPFRKNSKACSSCPLKKWCSEQPAGDIKIEPLEFNAYDD